MQGLTHWGETESAVLQPDNISFVHPDMLYIARPVGWRDGGSRRIVFRWKSNTSSRMDAMLKEGGGGESFVCMQVKYISSTFSITSTIAAL